MTDTNNEYGVHDAEMTNTEPLVTAPAPGQVREPSRVLAPSFALEDQEELMQTLPQTQVIGPPGYASPDPETNRGLLLPIEEHPLSGELSEDYGASVARPAEVVPASPLGNDDGGDREVMDVSKADDSWTKKDWQNAAKSRGVGVSGSVDTIKKRIKEHDKAVAEREEEADTVRNMKREELDSTARDFEINPDEYSRAEDLAEAVIAAMRDEPVPVGDKAGEADGGDGNSQ